MTAQDKATLKAYFQNGEVPDENDYVDLIDSIPDIATAGTVTSIATSLPITGGPITNSGTIGINAATTTDPGSMSAADKTKLDGLVSNATHTGDVTGSTALTIGANKVTLAMLSRQYTNGLLGKSSIGLDNINILSVSEVIDLLQVVVSARNVQVFEPLFGGGNLTADVLIKIRDASNTTAGVMSSADKIKLDAIDTSAFAKLAGIAGGQTLNGGMNANDDLTLQGTSHATRTSSYISLQPNGGFVGIGNPAPSYLFDIKGTGNERIMMHTTSFGGHIYTIAGSDGGHLYLRPASGEVYLLNGATPTALSLYNGATYSLKLNSNGYSYFKGGNVGFGIDTPSVAVEVAGDISVSNFTGWNNPRGTWAYAAANQIYIPAGGLLTYSVGDRIKFTQSAVVKYFYVIGVFDTVLVLSGGSDFTVANTTISANYFSKVASPVGFPSAFNFPSTPYGSGGSAGAYSEDQLVSRFSVNGRICSVISSRRILNKGSWTGFVMQPKPIAAVNNANSGGLGEVLATGSMTRKAVIVGTNDAVFNWHVLFGQNQMDWPNHVAINDWFHIRGSYEI